MESLQCRMSAPYDNERTIFRDEAHYYMTQHDRNCTKIQLSSNFEHHIEEGTKFYYHKMSNCLYRDPTLIIPPDLSDKELSGIDMKAQEEEYKKFNEANDAANAIESSKDLDDVLNTIFDHKSQLPMSFTYYDARTKQWINAAAADDKQALKLYNAVHFSMEYLFDHVFSLDDFHIEYGSSQLIYKRNWSDPKHVHCLIADGFAIESDEARKTCLVSCEEVLQNCCNYFATMNTGGYILNMTFGPHAKHERQVFEKMPEFKVLTHFAKHAMDTWASIVALNTPDHGRPKRKRTST